MNGNYQLPRREELRSQCSLKKEHRSNENEMMGLSANVAWYLIIVAPPEMLTLSFIWLLLLQFKCLKRSYFEITARIFIFPTLKQNELDFTSLYHIIESYGRVLASIPNRVGGCTNQLVLKLINYIKITRCTSVGVIPVKFVSLRFDTHYNFTKNNLTRFVSYSKLTSYNYILFMHVAIISIKII